VLTGGTIALQALGLGSIPSGSTKFFVMGVCEMGLDMYLYAERAVYSGLHKDDAVIEHEVRKIVPLPFKITHEAPVRRVCYEVAYWRKANHIHDWFVKNVQGGEDDCGYYYVDIEQLEELVTLCKAVIADKDKAPELMATKAGFFFGGTDYDEWYFHAVEHTIKMIEPLLEKFEGYYDWDFKYHSSW
jgi:hypothetical protein